MKNRGYKLIALSEKVFNLLNKLSFAKKRVPKGSYTDTHFHALFSAYLVENMEYLLIEKEKIKMPKFGLVIVYPKINHTWSNASGNTDNCYVSDLSPAHGEHVVYES